MQNDYLSVDQNKLIPLNLLSNETLFYKINCRNIPSFLKKIIKIPFYLIEKFNFYTIWNLIIFSRLLRKVKPELLHINNGGYPAAKSCNTLVWANQLFWRAKVIYQVNNQAADVRGWDAFFDKKIEKFVDTFLTASFLAKERLVSARKFDKNKIEVINNCIISEEIGMDRNQICAELSFSKETFIITQVGFLTERKGQAYLIDALFLLFKRRKELKQRIELLLIGDGEDKNKLMELIKERDLQENIHFLGYKRNSVDYIAASDVFVLPSVSNEDMPLVILTALELGKAIIASGFAGIAQVIESGINGILVDYKVENLSDNLSAEIELLFSDDILRKKLSIAAQQTFLEYTPQKYGEKLSSLYSRILNNNHNDQR